MTFILLHAVSSSGLHAYKPALTLFLLEKCFSSLFNQYSSNSGHLCLSCPILSSIYKGPLAQLAPHSIFTGLWTSLPYWWWWYLLACTSLGYMACIHGILGVIAYNINSDYIRMYIYSRSFKMWPLSYHSLYVCNMYSLCMMGCMM